jgi:hypothetical protein
MVRRSVTSASCQPWLTLEQLTCERALGILEIVEAVLDRVFELDVSERYPVLCAASLVARAWRAPSQDRLQSEVVLRGFGLASKERARVKRHLRRFKTAIRSYACEYGRIAFDGPHCPLDDLARGLNGLERLSLCSPSALAGAASAWPRLRMLIVRGVTDEDLVGAGMMLALDRLTLRDAGDDWDPLHFDARRWTPAQLEASFPVLRYLRIEATGTISRLTSALYHAQCRPIHLRADQTYIFELGELVGACGERVRILSVGNVHPYGDDDEAELRKLASTIPPTVQQLSFDALEPPYHVSWGTSNYKGGYGVPIDSIPRIVSSAPELQQLRLDLSIPAQLDHVVDGPRRGAMYAVVQSLVATCGARGIDLVAKADGALLSIAGALYSPFAFARPGPAA